MPATTLQLSVGLFDAMRVNNRKEPASLMQEVPFCTVHKQYGRRLKMLVDSPQTACEPQAILGIFAHLPLGLGLRMGLG